MNDLNINWKPTFGTVYTWFAMDKNGLIAVLVNNTWGNLPQTILGIPSAELLLDHLNDFMWEESVTFNTYPSHKNGKTILDLYSSVMYRNTRSRQEVEHLVAEESKHDLGLRDENISSRKGYFVYLAVDGNTDGEDYPVGYEKVTHNGDYYRYTLPTIYASIHDFPKELWHGIAVSNSLDFTKDRVLDNDRINEYFPRNYHTE